jgi:hypothetical protein
MGSRLIGSHRNLLPVDGQPGNNTKETRIATLLHFLPSERSMPRLDNALFLIRMNSGSEKYLANLRAKLRPTFLRNL